MSETTSTGTKERMNREFMAAVMARRLPRGWLVNLGIGIPTKVSGYVNPEQEIIFTSENGVIGYAGLAAPHEVDPDVVNASVEYVTLHPGAAIIHHADSFGLIRRGMNDVTILGTYEVAQDGSFANWRTSMDPWDNLGGIGGAMDLAVSSKHVWIAMEHTTRDGKPRLLEQCILPVTAVGVVDTVFTDLGVFSVQNGRFVLEEHAPGWTVEEIRALTGAPLEISPTLREVQFPV